MLTLLSPAKKMNMAPTEQSVPATQPRLLDDMNELAVVANGSSRADFPNLLDR